MKALSKLFFFSIASNNTLYSKFLNEQAVLCSLRNYDRPFDLFPEPGVFNL